MFSIMYWLHSNWWLITFNEMGTTSVETPGLKELNSDDNWCHSLSPNLLEKSDISCYALHFAHFPRLCHSKWARHCSYSWQTYVYVGYFVSQPVRLNPVSIMAVSSWRTSTWSTCCSREAKMAIPLPFAGIVITLIFDSCSTTRSEAERAA